jgi:hypothetical protein
MNMRLPIPIPHASRGLGSTTKRFEMWPIHVEFASDKYTWRSWFTWHGWEVGADGLGKLVYGWTFHLGPLKIMFGDREYGKR